MRAEEAVPMNQAKNMTVALGQPHGPNYGGSFEAGKAEGLHTPTVAECQKVK